MSKTNTLPVALIQEKNHGDAEANLSVIESRVAEAAKRGARLVLLQELHNGAYFCQHESVDEFDLAEPIPGPSTQRLGKLAKQHGATDAEIKEAIAVAALVRQWSTVLNGSAYDMKEFKAEFGEATN